MIFRISSLIVVVCLCISVQAAYAQNNELGSGCSRKNEEEKDKKDKDKEKPKQAKVKKSTSLVTLDFSFLPYRTVIDEKRISDLSVQLGTVRMPWEKEMKFKYAFAPRITASTKNFKTMFELGLLKNESSSGPSRITRQLELESDGSLFFVMGGVDGFAFYEDVFGAIQILHQTSDFFHRAYGVRGRVGFKIGGFHSNFLTVRFSKGIYYAGGDQSYNLTELSLPPEDLPLYNEYFDVQAVSTEARYGFPYFSLGSEIESNWYQRRLNSPDPMRFGRNSFNDVTARNSVEVIPFGPKHDTFRIVLEMFTVYGHKERLLFKYDPPRMQLVARIAF